MSCALWLHNYELRPIIIERETALGGMARRSPTPTRGCSGDRAKARVRRRRIRAPYSPSSVETWLGARPASSGATGTGISGSTWHLARQVASGFCRDRARCRRHAIVIATGTRFRRRGVARTGSTMRGDWRRKDACMSARPGQANPAADLGSHVAVVGRRRQCVRCVAHAGREGRAGEHRHALAGAESAAADGAAAAPAPVVRNGAILRLRARCSARGCRSQGSPATGRRRSHRGRSRRCPVRVSPQ